MLALASALADRIPTRYAIEHPMEGHPEAVARFGPPDGTLKIYDLPISADGPRYREQAETNEAFAAHSDGLGYAGLIAVAALMCERPPLWGGYTTFMNMVRLSMLLAEEDREAFEALFLPDAITCLRPRGKGAIRVSAPVLYLAPGGQPRVFLRVGSGEYRVSWREDPALNRARAWCEERARPFSQGGTFVHMMRPGEGVFIRNQHVIHTRTPFVDPPAAGRVLARKWYVESEDETSYRHVPAVALDRAWADLAPDRFGPDRVTGDWNYDASSGRNVRVR